MLTAYRALCAAVQAARAAFLQAQTLMLALEQELPDTAAALRLSGLELSDCFEEMSLLRCAWGLVRVIQHAF